ncbi:MAG TPA: hypothetical protein VHV10_15845 [Ktedonobacteraceae bacterium]|nr:hypothetical protein [Ktedonobacteraceae bacterium]
MITNWKFRPSTDGLFSDELKGLIELRLNYRPVDAPTFDYFVGIHCRCEQMQHLSILTA